MTFDMHAARQYAETSPLISHKPYIAALDEIGRLRTIDAAMQAQIVANAGRIAELEIANTNLKSSMDTDVLCRQIKSDGAYIKELQKKLTDTEFVCNHKYLDLQQICDDQATQIAAMTKICISERNRYLVDFIHEYDEVMDCEQEAIEEMAKEYPEIFAEERE